MNQACPLPLATSDLDQHLIDRLLRANVIAVVGLSDNPEKASYGVAAYLLSVGKQIVPVNPHIERVLGLKAVASLADVHGQIDLVNVFRRPEYCADVAHQAVQAGAKGIWLQSGIVSREARKIAATADLDYVEDHCLMVEHRRTTYLR